jgi:hypothetical protein
MVELFSYYKDKPVNLIVLNIEDSEFFNRFHDGVPTYVDGGKRVETNYAMVHLDGPHDSIEVMKEVQFFYMRMLPGSMLVCDDTHMYPHFEKCHQPIIDLGFVEWKKGVRKIAYEKV